MTEPKLDNIPKEIDGERIKLILHDDKYAESYYNTIDNNREFLSQYLDWVDRYTSISDTLEYFNEKRENWEKQTEKAFLIIKKDIDAAIGSIGTILILSKHHYAELGYWLASQYNGKGYMKEAMGLIENALFQEHFERIVIEMEPENVPSKNVAERCGYTFEGCARHGVKRPSGFSNILTYSKLKYEWEAEQKS